MTDDSDDAVTLAEMLSFSADQVDQEVDTFDGDVPKHAARLLTGNAADLQRTIVNIEMARANESQHDPSDEHVKEALEEDAVDVLLSVGALAHEYDLDLATAFSERMEFIEDYQNLKEALEDAETREEKLDAFDEHMDESAEELMQGVEAGTNVDSEDYDPDNVDKSFH